MGTICIRTVQAFVAGSLVILGSLPAVANPPRGFFVTHCGFSHSLRDDPIMFPGAPGASHRHEFFGSVRTSARSTERRMRTGPTTCTLTADTAAYRSRRDRSAACGSVQPCRRRTTSASRIDGWRSPRPA